MPYKNYNFKMNEYMKKRYNKRRIIAYTLLGGKCSVCGTKQGLEIDHIDWRQKKIHLNKLWAIKLSRFIGELRKCQLLCHDHHADKNRKDLSEIASLRESKRKVIKNAG